MNNPRSLFSRAQAARRQFQAHPAAPLPAPTPILPPRQDAPSQPPVDNAAPQSPIPARPMARTEGHALYRELMRSHDRMGTQHLK